MERNITGIRIPTTTSPSACLQPGYAYSADPILPSIRISYYTAHGIYAPSSPKRPNIGF